MDLEKLSDIDLAALVCKSYQDLDALTNLINKIRLEINTRYKKKNES